MPKFHVTCTCRASIRETWEVEADSAEAARAVFDDQDATNMTFLKDEILGDEEGRVFADVYPAPSI